MAAVYERLAATAASLLASYGTPVTMRRVLKGDYNPATGRHAPDTTLEWRPVALCTDASMHWRREGLVDGGRIRSGEMRILVDCSGWPHVPRAGDKAVFANGESWIITGDMPLAPAGKTLLYRGTVRRG